MVEWMALGYGITDYTEVASVRVCLLRVVLVFGVCRSRVLV